MISIKIIDSFKMTTVLRFMECFVFLMPLFLSILSQEITVPKPKFPDVFQVEVTGIFQSEKTEADAALYYDRINNRVALIYTYQNDTTTSIYDFNDSQLIYIDGFECSVSEIGEESRSFFQYHVDKVTKKKTIGSPEEIFFFTKAEFDRQELLIFPSYIFTSNIDIPQYGLKECEITHIFSKPEVEMPDCEGQTCKPTLISITLRCPPPDEEETEFLQIYNFFRFRSSIKDESVFLPPAGIHCNLNSHEPFPEFPRYFSFSYDLKDEQKWGKSAGVYTYHEKVWYDAKLNLVRMDEYDDGGLLTSSRIYDFYSETAYLIIVSEPICEFSGLDEKVTLDSMSRLPKIFFAKTLLERKNTVYVGKRNVNGMIYDVWTISNVDPLSDAKITQEFYFTNNLDPTKENSTGQLQISHAYIYTYQRTGDANSYELSLVTYLSINDYRSSPKEWEAFDVSACFSGDQKKGFSLKVNGPPVIKNSYMYEMILEKLYMKLIILTNASVIRISELEGIFDGVNITEFRGWILNTVEQSASKSEPNMEETYNIIENAVNAGKLVIKVNNNGEVQLYSVTAISSNKSPKHQNTTKSCFSGGTVAASGIVLLLIGVVFSSVGYCVFLKKKTLVSSDKMQLTPVVDHS